MLLWRIVILHEVVLEVLNVGAQHYLLVSLLLLALLLCVAPYAIAYYAYCQCNDERQHEYEVLVLLRLIVVSVWIFHAVRCSGSGGMFCVYMVLSLLRHNGSCRRRGILHRTCVRRLCSLSRFLLCRGRTLHCKLYILLVGRGLYVAGDLYSAVWADSCLVTYLVSAFRT